MSGNVDQGRAALGAAMKLFLLSLALLLGGCSEQCQADMAEHSRCHDTITGTAIVNGQTGICTVQVPNRQPDCVYE